FGAGQVIDILLGKKTPKVIENDHASLTVFGVGTELSEREWRGVVRQLLARGLLAVVGDYGTLALTEGSGAVLSGQRQVPLRPSPPPCQVKRARCPAGTSEWHVRGCGRRVRAAQAVAGSRGQGAGRPRLRDLP